MVRNIEFIKMSNSNYINSQQQPTRLIRNKNELLTYIFVIAKEEIIFNEFDIF